MKDGLPVEAHITAGLNHTNVVRTIAHAWRPLSAHVTAGMSVWDSADSALGAASEGETWLLLELCDRGTLQVGSSRPRAQGFWVAFKIPLLCMPRLAAAGAVRPGRDAARGFASALRVLGVPHSLLSLCMPQPALAPSSLPHLQLDKAWAPASHPAWM